MSEIESSVRNAAVSVTSTATLVAPGTTTRSSLVMVNNGSVTVFVGAASVTTATGTPVAAGASISLSNFNGALYGIVASGTCDVRTLEEL